MWAKTFIAVVCIAGAASAATMTDDALFIDNPAPTQTQPPAVPLDIRGPMTDTEEFDWDSVEWTTIVDEPYECFDADVPQYFKFPEPSGKLLDAFHSYASKIIPTSCDHVICTAEPSDWCAFSTARPSAVASDFDAYRKSLVSWYTLRSESIEALPTECPDSWSKGKVSVVFGERRLNNTIAWGECWRTDLKFNGKREQPDLAAVQYL